MNCRRLITAASIFAVTAFTLVGCGESKAAALAQCHIEAMKTYPSKSQYGDEVQLFVLLCMEVKGYSPSSLTSCIGRGKFDEACYQSHFEYWWRRIVFG